MTSSPSVSRLLQVDLPGPAGRLEGLLQTREGSGPDTIAVVCHPHPLYGGTLHNKVVHRVASVLSERGVEVLRFNFRGVGKSEGTFADGGGEVEDARAALRWLTARAPAARRWLAGFSFGSWIAARLAAAEPDVERLILVAPPVTRSGFGVLRSTSVPKLVIQGTADTVCPPAALEADFPSWSEPKRLILVPGATHFFDKQLAALAQALDEALPPASEGATS